MGDGTQVCIVDIWIIAMYCGVIFMIALWCYDT